jgi:hypothetical protein
MVELRYLYDNEPCENTLYFHKVGAWTVEELDSLGTAINAWWFTNIQPLISVHASLTEIFITDLTTPTSAAVGNSFGLPAPGDVAGEAMSNNVAPCISFRTANRGRSFRGRNYLLGISVDSVSGNEIIGGFITAMIAAYNALFALATSEGVEWVVVSRYSGVELVDGKKKPIPREEGISTPIVSVLFTDNTVDSQRGRLPNH